jgi:hypothetical protein
MGSVTFTYKQFVDEVRRLAQEAEGLRGLDLLDEDPRFRKWRHELTDMLERVGSIGYEPNCKVVYRQFSFPSARYGRGPSQEERISRFVHEINDTQIELNTIISNYDKFGAPAGKRKEDSNTLKAPENVTLAWLWNHVPAKLWWSAAIMFLAVLSTGIFLGQSSMYREVMDKLKTAGPDSQSEAKK